MARTWTQQAQTGSGASGAEPSSDPQGTLWSKPPGLDPYFRWALHTNWRGFARLAGWDDTAAEPQPQIRIIAALCEPEADQSIVNARLAAVSKHGKVLRVPHSYSSPVPGTDEKSRHISATVDLAQVDWLLRNPLELRWKLAMPMRDAERVAKASSKGLYGKDRDFAQFQGDHVLKAELKRQGDLPAPRPVPGAIALIDNGCPFLNLVFQSSSGTRVAALWDQGAVMPPPTDPRLVEGGWPWQLQADFGYGRELGPTAMNVMTRAVRTRPEIDEAMIYRGIDHLIDYEDPRRRVWFATHGGHLLHVAGGYPDPLNGEVADMAADAALLFVQLPLLAAMDSAGASLAPHILDGVRYAMSLCDKGQPLVVSISYGGQAGPHDGSSPIEEALQELLTMRRDNFAVVLAAGNARLVRGHADRLLRPERSVLLRCQMPEGDITDSFVEIWYDAPKDGAAVEIRVCTPEKLWSPWVAAGREVLYRESGFGPAVQSMASVAANPSSPRNSPGTGNDVVAMLRHDLHVPNGRRAMALLAMAPTAQPPDIMCALADAGQWEVEIRLVVSADATATPVRIQAWIERDDPGLGTGAQRPFFVDQVPADEYETLSSLASNPATIRAGGFNLGTREPAPYSALGSPGGKGPDVLAACEEDESQPSIAATATRSGEICRLNGTSVSAPVLARRLYNLMALGTIGREEWPRVLEELASDEGDPCLRTVTEG